MAADPDQLAPLWDSYIKRIYDEEIQAGQIDVPTAVHMADTYMKGVVEGFGASFETLDTTSPDYEMLDHLENNVYKFSGAKSFEMNRELTRLIRNGDTIRPYKEFRAEALDVVNEWVNEWGTTEYNTAVSSAQMASKWVQYEAQEKILPNLKYVTMRDARVRPEHRELDGIIRPINDAFWNMYYPPNGWNCRCTAIQDAHSGDITHDVNMSYPDVPEIFRTNLAKNGMVFPQNTPYFENIGKRKLNRFLKDNKPKHD